jgi:hypothetical protein
MTDLMAEFDRVSPQLSAALAHDDTHTLDDVRELVLRGEAQLWAGVRSVLVTQIINTPQKRLLHFFLAGGDLDEIQAMQYFLLDWGRQQGCVKATMLGRRGWERTFLTREDGWDSRLVYMTKELDHG